MLFLLIDFFLYCFPIWYTYNENEYGRPVTLEKIKQAFKASGFKAIGFLRNLKKTVLLLFVLVVANLVIAYFFTAIGITDSEKVLVQVIQLYNTSPLLLTYLLTVRVIGEEIFFRGFLVRKFGILLPAIVFGLSHALYGSIVEIIGTFLLGIILGKAFQANKSILPNITAHLMYNVVILMLMIGV